MVKKSLVGELSWKFVSRNVWYASSVAVCHFLKRKFEIAIMNFNDFASMECHGIFNGF